MKKIYFILALCILTATCQHAMEKPKNLLSKNKMAQILAEIYLYKQTPDNMPLSPGSAFETYVSIFKKYNITKEQFEESFTYYYSDIKPMENIYDKTIENLKNQLSNDELKKLKEETKIEEAKINNSKNE